MIGSPILTIKEHKNAIYVQEARPWTVKLKYYCRGVMVIKRSTNRSATIDTNQEYLNDFINGQ